MSKMFVAFELGYDATPVHGVYTDVYRAVISCMRVEEAYATDYGMSIEFFDTDQEIELETISDDTDSSTCVKYVERGIITVERLESHDVSIQVSVSVELTLQLNIDVVELINRVCAELGFSIANTRRLQEVDYFELVKD